MTALFLLCLTVMVVFCGVVLTVMAHDIGGKATLLVCCAVLTFVAASVGLAGTALELLS